MKKILWILGLTTMLFITPKGHSVTVPRPLRNLGNTCYMNATLQCLYQIKPLTDFLLREGKNFYKPNTLTLEYIDFLDKTLSKNPDENSIPEEDEVEKKEREEGEIRKFCNPMFKKFFQGSEGQQDASEFLQLFLHHLTDEDIKNDRKRNEFIPGTSTRKNLISDLFFLILENTITPLRPTDTCISSSKTEGASKLDLEILARAPKDTWKNIQEYNEFAESAQGKKLAYSNLEDCLQAFTKGELLTGNNQYECSDYTLVDAIKSFKIEEAPPFLILVLKRFINIGIENKNTPEIFKLSHKVSFPLRNLNLTPYMTPHPTQQKATYDLMGFVQQAGSLRGGHYTSYVKNDNKWYYCNDTNIIPTDEKNIQKIANEGIDQGFTPYVLFYKRNDIPISSKEPEEKAENISTLKQLENQLQSLSNRAKGTQ